MANEKISELSAAAALDGTEEVPVVQSGSTVKTTTQDIADLGGGGGVESVVAGDGISVDDTDPSNPVVSATGGLGYSVATATLNNDQIKALPNTPIQLVAAPGANKMIIVNEVVIQLNISVKYTLSTGVDISESSDIVITFGANVVNSSNTISGNYLSQVHNHVYLDLGTFLNPMQPVTINSNVENAPIYISSDSENGLDYIGGDASNVMGITIMYYIIDLH